MPCHIMLLKLSTYVAAMAPSYTDELFPGSRKTYLEGIFVKECKVYSQKI